LREARNNIPVLLLSARGQVNERVEGLNAGADDYLAKPFALAELIARVRSLGRRGGEPRQSSSASPTWLDTTTRQARRGDATFELSTREIPAAGIFMSPAGGFAADDILEKSGITI